MGRLVDENDVYSVLTEYYHHKTATQHVALIDALSTVKTADAIPVPWIEAEIKKLRDMDNGFASLSAGQIEAMLKKWREEQNGKSNQC